MRFLRVSKDFLLGEGCIECIKRVGGSWFMKRGHWYECYLSGDAGLVWMDSMNVHELVEIYTCAEHHEGEYTCPYFGVGDVAVAVNLKS